MAKIKENEQTLRVLLQIGFQPVAESVYSSQNTSFGLIRVDKTRAFYC